IHLSALFCSSYVARRDLRSFPTRRSSDLAGRSPRTLFRRTVALQHPEYARLFQTVPQTTPLPKRMFETYVSNGLNVNQRLFTTVRRQCKIHHGVAQPGMLYIITATV